MNAPIFHLAIPVGDIPTAKAFYNEGLGCAVGRESDRAAIFNFYGHQLVAHVTHEPSAPQKGVYPRHFGMVLPDESAWEAIWQRATEKQLGCHQVPKHRFPGEVTEHRTFFLADPFHNLLEFKVYRHDEAIFGCRELVAIGDR
ncbi:putative dioxygenase of extradiol dioxygenase family [Rubidibacter lacunae KORDI 51-2]|uniref:Putative dioxygenase of extradiol dioxygenase family n=1 Tax=Rubidibacter lacunae KORDI 51-2 TaxID=582515 RepID=U5DIN3_9CHRO|nr:VOC family protein [Rubidibacter lacunae]ERN40802.1 putative dioxygenase of extradiol dioxygenase family [Rubidibacter lacunae KORDI 51-2]